MGSRGEIGNELLRLLAMKGKRINKNRDKCHWIQNEKLLIKYMNG